MIAEMLEEDRRRPETMYRLNSELKELREAVFSKDRDDVQLQPSVYDPRLRGFRWMSVAPDRWRLDAIAPEIDDWLKELTHEAEIDHWTQTHERLWPGLTAAWDLIKSHRRGVSALHGKEARRMHRALLTLLASHVSPRNWGVDGVLCRINDARVAAGKLPLWLFEAKMLWQWPHLGPTARYPWLWVNEKIDGVDHRRGYCQHAPIEAINHDDAKLKAETHAGEIVHEQSWATSLLWILMNLGQKKDQLDRVLVIPIYDDPRKFAEGACSTLLGHLHALVRKSCPDYVIKNIRTSLEMLREGPARGLGRAIRDGARTSIAAESIEPREDVLGHFARTITYLEDWERLLVFRCDRVIGCWSRDAEQHWRACPGGCAECRAPGMWETVKQPDGSWVVWADLLDLMDIPWLTPDERYAMQGISFAFQYPAHAPRPANTPQREKFEREIWHRHASILQVLLPKVIKQRRIEVALDQLAAVAISARNMSHNVGSHVLSKLADPKCLEGLAGNPDDLNALALFHSYLRDRMDFIAELATATPSWSLSYRLGDVLTDATHVGPQPSGALQAQSILLKWIAGERRPSEVVLGQGAADFWIDVPHGSVGIQALFTILENSLRNSAKHGEKHPHRGQLTLHVQPGDGVYWLTIEDMGTEELSGASPTRLDALVCVLNDNLRQGFYDDAGTRVHEHWGLKEMKIAAAFLRMRHIEQASSYYGQDGVMSCTNPEAPAPWIEAIAIPDERTGTRRLGWRLALLRPKLVVSVQGPGRLIDPLASTAEAGTVWNEEDGRELPNLRHRFLCCLSEDASRWLEERRTSEPDWALRLPTRLIMPASVPVEGHRAIARVSEPNLSALQHAIANPSEAILEEMLGRLWLSGLASLAGYTSTRLIIADGEMLPSADTAPLAAMTASDQPVEILSERDLKGHDFVQTAPDAGEARIVYHRHGGTEIETTIDEDLYENLQYYSTYGGDSYHYSVIASACARGQVNVPLLRRLAEAGQCWVVALDERLSAWAATENPHAALRRAGVFVKQFADPDAILVEEIDKSAIQGMLKRQVDEVMGHPALLFITVHQGILDRTFSNREAVTTWIAEMRTLRVNGRSAVPTIVCVHSGRGRPPSPTVHTGPTKQEIVAFIEYSNLERWIRDSQSKFHLVDLFMSLRQVEHG